MAGIRTLNSKILSQVIYHRAYAEAIYSHNKLARLAPRNVSKRV
jgi:hypothetical protein